ncbi:MAG: hypothetical protein AB1941_00670 [Gemmatimonadota bacterium]
MLHITLTGAYAGTPICGVLRAVAEARGDDFAHMPYDQEAADALLARPSTCPDCIREWNIAGAEPAGEDSLLPS